MTGKEEAKKKPVVKKPRKKAKPAFNVLNYGFFKAVKERWRKPRGTANKKRRKNKWAGALPKIGYKNAEAVRGLREDGRREMLIRGMPDINIVRSLPHEERARICLRFASCLCRKTREKMAEAVKGLGVAIVNARKAKG